MDFKTATLFATFLAGMLITNECSLANPAPAFTSCRTSALVTAEAVNEALRGERFAAGRVSTGNHLDVSKLILYNIISNDMRSVNNLRQ